MPKEKTRNKEKHRHVERRNTPGKIRMVPAEKVASDYKQNADTFHDIESDVTLTAQGHCLKCFFNLLYKDNRPSLSRKNLIRWERVHRSWSQVVALWWYDTV